MTFSVVKGGWPGPGNIAADPLFVGGGDFHLTEGSPCIDAGVEAGLYIDIDADTRPFGAGYDIGADEYISGFTLVSSPSYKEGILDLKFHVGMFEPATWATCLILTYPSVQVVPIWTVPLPVIDPPIYITISFPFPQIGWIGILTTLRSGGAAQLHDLDWVDTGS